MKNRSIAMMVAAGMAGFLVLSAVPAERRLPSVVVVGTGGTIAGQAQSAASTASYAVAVVKVDDLVKAIPELAAVANVRSEQVAQIGSRLD